MLEPVIQSPLRSLSAKKQTNKKKNSRHFLVWKVTKYPSTYPPAPLGNNRNISGLHTASTTLRRNTLSLLLKDSSTYKKPAFCREEIQHSHIWQLLLPLHWNVLTMKNISIAHSTTHAALGLSYRSEYRPWIKRNKLMQATRQFNTHPPALCAGKIPDEKLQIGAIKFLTIGASLFSIKTPISFPSSAQ